MRDPLRLARPPTLTLLAAEKLRAAIISGQFEPGQRLVETDLSEQFGISRAPLREALRVLAGDGLVEIRQNRGCHVINPSAAEVEQMVLFRALLEGTAARLVTARRDRAVLEHLQIALDSMQASEDSADGPAFMVAHWLFHEHICLGSQNRFVIQSWANISNVIKIFLSRTLARLPDRSRILRNMNGFLRCFHSGDADEAEAVLRSMIIWMGFELLDAAIPEEIGGYVTHIIDPAGTLTRISREALAGRLRRSQGWRSHGSLSRPPDAQFSAPAEANRSILGY
jgi:DNA-binding GntR family transcriptional regulator